MAKSLGSAVASGRLKRSSEKSAARRLEQGGSPAGAWSPPDFGGNRRTRIGASIVEQFVAGHGPGDVLRELVQNEFDGGGDRLEVLFGVEALEIAGNGRGISADGWQRLSVIVGTGRVVGAANDERVSPKTNGIGSKNFGLRSLFIFGDEIYVRSGGLVCVLDLRTLETGRTRDLEGRGRRGVQLHVPFRRERFEMLGPFTPEREERAFNVMAEGMLATLVKLALPGRRPGLREVVLKSVRTQRALTWHQEAKSVRTKAPGVSATLRTGRLVDVIRQRRSKRDFQELEFSRVLQVSAEHAQRDFPAYFRPRSGEVRVSVSLPLTKGAPDFGRPGHFYYPLQASDARTGCLVSVSAPFELDSDRSSLLDSIWNEWLMDESARLVADLLSNDWTERFGAAAFRAVARDLPASPARFVEQIELRLKGDTCWPTRATGEGRLAKADKITVPADPALDGFLDDNSYLHATLAQDPKVGDLLVASGGNRFTLNSLVRLRCAGGDARRLATKLKNEADYRFNTYETSLREEARQVHMAEVLTALMRRLTPANREDLRSTPSTLAADGTLRPARDLVRVPPELWETCPEPLGNRLHPSLLHHRAIAGLCRAFEERNWIVEAAERASAGVFDEAERQAIYTRLLDERAQLGKRAMTAIRRAPVAKDRNGDWRVPDDMAVLKGTMGRFLSPVVPAPSKEILDRPWLIRRLHIRDRPAGTDIIAFAAAIGERSQSAERFERLLADNPRFLTVEVLKALRSLAFLRNRSGGLAAPADLYINTPVNRACVRNPDRIAVGSDAVLLRRLGVTEHPSAETLLQVIADARARSEAPPRPELLYPALVAAIGRERRARTDLTNHPLLWVDGGYHAPANVLVSTFISHVFDGVLPVLRLMDEPAAAYITLGAKQQARDEHWAKFFRHVSERWNGEPVEAQLRRTLAEAYSQRAAFGLPDGVSGDCLLARNGLLYSLNEMRAGQLVENDFAPLADALAASGSMLGIVDLTNRNRAFFIKLGIRPLSSVAGTGAPVFGAAVAKPSWFHPHHSETLLTTIARPEFARALYALSLRQRHSLPGFVPTLEHEVASRLACIEDVVFFDRIEREYEVGHAKARVPIEAAVGERRIGLVAPRTKLDFQQLITQALAEIAGAANLAQARTLATALLPLVLCRTNRDIVVLLERAGVNVSGWLREDADGADDDHETANELGEEIIRQMILGLGTAEEKELGRIEPCTPPSLTSNMARPTAPPPAPPPPLTLPALDAVALTVTASSDRTIDPRQPSAGARQGGSTWAPRTAAEVERDRQVGLRGEELVYWMEIERLRASGHSAPQEVVVWTSRNDPSADHDIRSVDAEGHPRWLEVKSTTGLDGRFEWSRREFERAMRERGRYELWRVYRAASATPIAKCFPNPAELLAGSRLQLELGSLRAVVEDAS